jgi:hypothetical protein
VVTRTINAAFVERVRRGDYEVDAHAVAEAMIRRWNGPAGGRRSPEGAPLRSSVLVAAEPFEDPPVSGDEDEPGAGGDLA